MQDDIQSRDISDSNSSSLPGMDTVRNAANEEVVDDVEIELYDEDNLSGGEMTLKDKVKELRQKLKDANKEKQDYLDGWQRLKADFANYKRRDEEGKEEFTKFARESLVADLLPVLESFQMAFANKEAWEKIDHSWRTGVEYINTQLVQVLSGHGLSELRPIGEEFDPNMHTSIGTVHTDDPTAEHKIAEVVQPGYMLSDKLIRSPKVKIFAVGEDATRDTSKE